MASMPDKNSDLLQMWAARRNRRNFTNFRCSSVTKYRYLEGGRITLPPEGEAHSHFRPNTSLLFFPKEWGSSLLFNRSKINLWMPMDWFCNWEVKLFSLLTLAAVGTWKLAVLVTFWLLLGVGWLRALLWLLWGRVKLEARCCCG